MENKEKIIDELSNAVFFIGGWTYETFLSTYNLDKNVYGDKTKFESQAIAAFFVLQTAHQKTKDKSILDGMLKQAQTKIGNLYLNSLPEVKEKGMLISRVHYYTDIFKESNGEVQFWLQKFVDLLIYSADDGELTLTEAPMHFGGVHEKMLFLQESKWNKWATHFICSIFGGQTAADAMKAMSSDGKFVDTDNPKKEGCYIATHIYGSYNSPEVIKLRNFRDNTLAKNILGRLFIQLYYLISPSLVKLLKGKNTMNNIIRLILDKLLYRIDT